jgi:hypothetical protein
VFSGGLAPLVLILAAAAVAVWMAGSELSDVAAAVVESHLLRLPPTLQPQPTPPNSH